MNRAEAFEYLTLAADQIGADWSKQRVSWIPDEVTQGVEDTVDDVLGRIDYRSEEWCEVSRENGRGRPRDRDEVREVLIAFTQNVVQERRSRQSDSVPGSAYWDGKRSELRQFYAELRVGRERAETEIRAQVEREEAAVRGERERVEAEQRKRWASRPALPPQPQPYGVSHEGAEHLVCAWMRHLGVPDAEVTRLVSDGGIDVDSEHYVAQVKNYVGSVPVGEVRALLGSAVSEGKKPLLFTSGSLTAEGAAFAARAGMAVFRYDAMSGTIQGLNELGAVAVERSIPEAFA